MDEGSSTGWHVVLSVPLAELISASVVAGLMQKSTEISEQRILPSTPHLFQGAPCIFKHDNVKTTFCTHFEDVSEKGYRYWSGLPAVLFTHKRAHVENSETKDLTIIPFCRGP